MPLPLPNLDDRNYPQLRSEAVDRIRQSNSGWDDLSPSDPGIVLLEVFAFLTETMIRRLNRLPEKAYIAFLRLLGVSLYPPSAAAVSLRFTRAHGVDGAIDIPEGTEVTLDQRGGSSTPPVFITTTAATLAANADAVDVPAVNAERINGELFDKATGQPNFSITLKHPPVIYNRDDSLDLMVGVELTPDDADQTGTKREFAGKTYRIWSEVVNFANVSAETPYVYIVDRPTGIITFPPALLYVPDDQGDPAVQPQALGAIPPAGHSICVWYLRGGGAQGNVGANTLKAIKSPLRGLQVTNPEAASGGRDAETIDNALLRGPKEFHSSERAVTAEDFEYITNRTLKNARAKAFTQATLWQHGQPGTVEMILAPYVPEDKWSHDGWLPRDTLLEYATDDGLKQVKDMLDQRRPLGTTCVVSWAHYKVVHVSATLVVRREEDRSAVLSRVLQRLYRTINPMPSQPLNPTGWQFGQALPVSDVYNAALSEPGVRRVDNVKLIVEEAPSNIKTIAPDFFQPKTWYAGSENHIFRTLNDGAGWENIWSFDPGEIVEEVEAHSHQPGLVAARTAFGDPLGSRIYISEDAGESWQKIATLEENHVEDLGWMWRDDKPVLLLASDKGLFQMSTLSVSATPTPIQIASQNAPTQFYAVTSVTDEEHNVVQVAVAAQNKGGVWLSFDGGTSNSFRQLKDGMDSVNIRVLAVQRQESQFFLWAGTTVDTGAEPGNGLYRYELRGTQDPGKGWTHFNGNWAAGSCHGLAFVNSGILAATHKNGILRLVNPDKPNPVWQNSDVNSGLPQQKLGRFAILACIAANPNGTLMMAGVNEDDQPGVRKGVYRAPDQDADFPQWQFGFASPNTFTDQVTLPESWLMVSGEHDIQAVSEDEAR